MLENLSFSSKQLAHKMLLALEGHSKVQLCGDTLQNHVILLLEREGWAL